MLGRLEQFDDAWHRGEPIPLEDLLRGAGGVARDELLRQALGLELDYRRRRGESPTLEGYLRRFPDDPAAVRDAFAEPTVSCAGESSAGPTGAEIPEQLGKFLVVGRLGAGGQGSALLARDLDLGRLVVLKRYHAAAGGPGGGALRDGRALTRLRSRYVPQCYGTERVGDELVLVMEYIPGRNLSEIIASDRPGPRASARLIEQAAAGLEAVHACGLVHRDIKPANVVVGDDWVPRLVDFGLAAHLGSAALHGVTGTPPYMAPEQARGQWEWIDGRTDIYGLGAVLYALLTGQAPHPGRTLDEALDHARAGAVTRPRALNRSVPRDLERVVLKALEADPARRYASASELRRALARCRFPHRYRRVGLAAALVLAAAAIYPVARWARPNPEPARPPAFQPPELIRVDRDGRAVALQDAVPLVSGDKLWIECDLPPGWQASAFWFDTEGRLTELGPLKIAKGRTADRLYYPPEDAVTVAGPPGTEFILVCARPGSRVGYDDVAAVLPIGNPWPALPHPNVVWMDPEHTAYGHPSQGRVAGISRGPGVRTPSAARDAIKLIEEARARLGSHVEYVVGVAFAHSEPAGTREGSETPGGAAHQAPAASGRVAP
jgi:hypothetical protein